MTTGVRIFGVPQLFMWTFGSTLALVVCFQLLEAIQPGAGNDLVSLGAVECLVYGVACFLVWQLYAASKPALEFFGVRRTHALLPVLGLALGVTLQAPADTLQYVVEAALGPASEERVLSRALLMRADNGLNAALMMLSAGCLVPLVEELLFRGAFFGGLRSRTSPLLAGVMTGIAFVVCHIELRVWLPLAAVAVVLSLLRVVSGSVLPGFALHLSFNAVTLALVVLKVVPVDQRLALPLELSLMGWGLSAAFLYGVIVVAKTEEAEQARLDDDAA
jgi:membrane protease YdiL (CAAX protease family)